MSGDPTNASLWENADVYIAPIGTSEPATIADPFPQGWELVGLLDGEAGFVHQRTWDTQDHFAWGNILVRTSRRNFKTNVNFTALEDNEATRQLIWPGSTGGDLIVPVPEDILIAFETTEGDTVRRLISAERAEVTIEGDITEGESVLTRYPLMATIYPDGDGVLWHEQGTDLPSSS